MHVGWRVRGWVGAWVGVWVDGCGGGGEEGGWMGAWVGRWMEYRFGNLMSRWEHFIVLGTFIALGTLYSVRSLLYHIGHLVSQWEPSIALGTLYRIGNRDLEVILEDVYVGGGRGRGCRRVLPGSSVV
jgi:hypothetical protein